MSATFPVRFMHPRGGRTYRARVNSQLTMRDALFELLSPHTGPFLPPRQPGYDYQIVLQRTNTIIPLNKTMGAAGVTTNDLLQITLDAKSAWSLCNHHRSHQ